MEFCIGLQCCVYSFESAAYVWMPMLFQLLVAYDPYSMPYLNATNP